MQLDEMIGQIEAAVLHVESGDLASAWKDTISVQQAIIDLLQGKTVPTMGGTPEKGQKLVGCLKKLETAADNCCKAPVKGTEVGKLFPGDGSFLKNLATFILTILPAIMPFLPKSA